MINMFNRGKYYDVLTTLMLLYMGTLKIMRR